MVYVRAFGWTCCTIGNGHVSTACRHPRLQVRLIVRQGRGQFPARSDFAASGRQHQFRWRK